MKKILLAVISVFFFTNLYAGVITVNDPIGLSVPAYTEGGGGGGSTIVTGSSPIVSSAISGGYNVSCPTCVTSNDSILAYQQAFGVPAAGSISGGPYITIGPNGTTLKLQSPDKAAESVLSTDNNYDLVQNAVHSLNLIANNGEINFYANSFIVNESTVLLKNKNTGIVLGVWNKDNGTFGLSDPETGLFSAFWGVKNVDGQSWLQIGDGNTTQPIAFNHNTNKNGVVYLDDNYRMNTPVLLSGQALVGNTGIAPTPQDILLSTTPLNSIAAPNADVSLGNYKINNLKPGTLSTDAATVGQANTVLAKVYYVSTTGNDLFGTGSQTAPFATVNKALSLIPANNATNVTIYVAPGSYTENIIVTKQRVDIVGMEAPSSQPKAIKFPSISITTVGSNVGNYVDNGVSISNLTFAARSGIETYAMSYTGSNLFVSLNDVLIGNDANIDGILMNVTDSSRLYINNSSVNVSGTAVGMKFARGELWDFRNSACTSGNADCIVSSTNNVAIYSAINSSFSSNFHVFNFTGSNNKGVIATFSQCFIQGVPTGNLNTDAIIQLGASFIVSFNNSSLVNAGGNAQVGNAIVYLGSSSALLLTYSSVSSTATNAAAFVPFKSQAGNNSILQYYGNVFLSSGGTNVYSKPVSGVGGFLLVSKMQTDS